MGVFMSIYWIDTDDQQALLMENVDIRIQMIKSLDS